MILLQKNQEGRIADENRGQCYFFKNAGSNIVLFSSE